ncbi:MAG: hypothetical protein JWM15_2392 [Cryptosporangiaceae bacterium]|nr:hypothetical protein [Cryptosporangiaceae bacterium]
MFEGQNEPVESVDRLLVVGFYLVNLGFVSFASKTGSGVAGPTESVEALGRRLGLVLVVLGALHLGNVLALSRMRRGTPRRSGRSRRSGRTGCRRCRRTPRPRGRGSDAQRDRSV